MNEYDLALLDTTYYMLTRRETTEILIKARLNPSPALTLFQLFNLEFVLLSVASAVSTCAAIGIGVFSYKFLTMQYDVNFQVAGYISGRFEDY